MRTILGIDTVVLAIAIGAPAAAADRAAADPAFPDQQSDIVVTGQKLEEVPQAGKSDVPLTRIFRQAGLAGFDRCQ